MNLGFAVQTIGAGSVCETNLVDFIEFKGSGNQPEVIASFAAPEIYPFLQYYARGLCENLRQYRA
jgi:hypothetical protein